MLSDNPDASVLLIEAGPYTLTSPISLPSIPGLTALNVASKALDWNLKLVSQKATLKSSADPGFRDRSIPIPRGKVLGGSNELNFMLFVEGTKGDYEHWAKTLKSESWNFATMKRHIESHRQAIQPSVKTEETSHLLSNAFVRAHPSAFLFTSSVKSGVRSSTARAYTHPRLQDGRENLRVYVNAPVSRLLHEDKRVNGVEFEGGGRAIARKEVVLCSGAYHSPHLLLKSGIGNEHIGKHLQDHPILGLKYRLGSEGGTWWPKSMSYLSVFGNPMNLCNYVFKSFGPLSTSGADFGLFESSNSTFKDGDRPDLQIHGMPTAGDGAFLRDFLQFEPNFQASFGVPNDYSPLFAQGLIIAPTLLHPNSEGSVTLGDNGEAVIELESFTDEDDLDRIVKAVRLAQEVMRAPAMMEHDPHLLEHTVLAKELGQDTDEYWREYARLFGFFVYHPASSVRMSASPASGAVDPKCRVWGWEGIRVADASVMPSITSGNTNVPTAAIAHNCVEIMFRG